MAKLEIDQPHAECRHCGFSNGVVGEWSIEDGRLVFRAAADPLPYRGPSLGWCGECGETFDVISVYEKDWRDLPANEVAALVASAESERPEG